MAYRREQVLRILEENRAAIQALGVRRLGLFGSCARDEHSVTSDLDFLVEFEFKTFDNYMDLKAFLEKLFACEIDLVVSDAVKPRLGEIIRGEAVYAPGL